tara:strand:+ start:544 stop:789 length:246 start_codon:yes stop_codon:yes gene_type:complete
MSELSAGFVDQVREIRASPLGVAMRGLIGLVDLFTSSRSGNPTFDKDSAMDVVRLTQRHPELPQPDSELLEGDLRRQGAAE